MNEVGKTLVILGVAIAAVGLALWFGGGRLGLGRLPGDIHYSRGGFSFYFPLVTCLLLSALFSALFWLFRR